MSVLGFVVGIVILGILWFLVTQVVPLAIMFAIGITANWLEGRAAKK